VEPRSLQELSCVLSKLIEAGKFDHLGSRQDVRQAAQELTGAILSAFVNGTELTPCQRLLGALLIPAVDDHVTESNLVTIQDDEPSRI
jgi:hypothetical protein